MRLLLTVFLVGLASFALAQVSQPSPPPQTPNQTSPEAPKPAPDLRGTEQSPVFVRAPDLPGTEKSPVFVRAIKSKEELEQEANDRVAGASSQSWTVASTVFAVLFNGILAFFTWRLYGVSRRQANILKEHGDHLAATTRVSKESADAANKSAKAAEQLIATTMRAEAPFLIPEVSRTYGRGSRPCVVWAVRNHGKTPAVLRRFQDRLRLYENLPDEPDFEGEPLSARPERFMRIGLAHVPEPEGHTGHVIDACLHPDDTQHLHSSPTTPDRSTW